jgi:hypothetical protein
MKSASLLAALVVGSASLSASTATLGGDYHLCKSTYALCTTAKCTRGLANTDTAACACEVRTGYSVGTGPCRDAPAPSAGTKVLSRYYPIKSYARCTNNRPWAFCHDQECVVDRHDPSKAICTCAIKAGAGDYVRVTESFTAETCTIGLHSAATVDELHRITNFLKEQVSLAPFPLRVLNADRLGAIDRRW